MRCSANDSTYYKKPKAHHIVLLTGADSHTALQFYPARRRSLVLAPILRNLAISSYMPGRVDGSRYWTEIVECGSGVGTT